MEYSDHLDEWADPEGPGAVAHNAYHAELAWPVSGINWPHLSARHKKAWTAAAYAAINHNDKD